MEISGARRAGPAVEVRGHDEGGGVRAGAAPDRAAGAPGAHRQDGRGGVQGAHRRPGRPRLVLPGAAVTAERDRLREHADAMACAIERSVGYVNAAKAYRAAIDAARKP